MLLIKVGKSRMLWYFKIRLFSIFTYEKKISFILYLKQHKFVMMEKAIELVGKTMLQCYVECVYRFVSRQSLYDLINGLCMK